MRKAKGAGAMGNLVNMLDQNNDGNEDDDRMSPADVALHVTEVVERWSRVSTEIPHRILSRKAKLYIATSLGLCERESR